jgi:glycosyltransferase A (GT-A) superfamily protein (DUF2064 family)
MRSDIGNIGSTGDGKPPRDVALVLFARCRENAAKSLGLGRGDRRLARLLLAHALETARAAASQMAVAIVTDGPLPPEQRRALARDDAPHEILHLLQQGDDFESRLLDALERVAARGYRRLVLVGSDTPALDPADLRRGAAASQEAVVGPSSDGGFYLLAIDSAHLDALAGLPWRRNGLLRALRQRLQARGLTVATLCTRDDLDDARDVQRTLKLLDALHRRYFGEALREQATHVERAPRGRERTGWWQDAPARAPPA